MNELSRHIEILLLDNDCVIVPGLGGFVAHHVPAEYVEHVFMPPCRTIGFNPQLKHNDYLLAQSFVEAYDISTPEAIRRIEKEVEEIRQLISIEGQCDFDGIGTLRLDAGEKITFSPCKAGLLTPSLYALSSFAIEELTQQTTNAEYLADEDTCPVQERHSAIIARMSAIKKAAAAILILVLFTLSILPAGKGSTGIEQSSVVNASYFTTKQTRQSPLAKQATVVKTQPAQEENAPDNEVMQAKAQGNETLGRESRQDGEAATPVTPAYTIVMASKITEKGAEDYVMNLRASGYDKAEQYGSGSSLRVIYGRYATEQQAVQELRSLRETDEAFKDCWTMKIN